MSDKLKIITLGIAVICIAPLIISTENEKEEPQNMDDIKKEGNENSYLTSFNFSQKKFNLDHEFVQYKILFHENTTIDYEYFLKFRVKDIQPHYYFLAFTDGKKAVMEREVDGKFYETPLLGYSMIPSGILMDLNLGNFRLSIGKLLFKILPIGNIDRISGEVEVSNGTEWFLTLGVYHKSVDEKFYINLESEKNCIEIIELDRDNKIEFLSSVTGDFSGVYLGLKILSRGFSRAKNLKTTITTTKGSVISFSSSGHITGHIEVIEPNGISYNKNTRKLASFQYYGNQTGTWKFSSSGIGFGWKHIVSLFYIDVNPYYYLSDWDS
jgi:hypothetical protein